MTATAAIKWPQKNNSNPYIGYCTASTDGTFMVASLDGTTYTTGLSIGGSSGNLLWKGKKILDASNYTEYANKYVHPTYTARTGKPTANQTPAFGGTATVSQITSDATGHVTAATDRTITIPSTLSNGTGTAGLIKTSSTVTSNSGYTACPVISGVPYYKDTNTTYGVATSSALGLVKSGTDITVDANGNVSVNDSSHNHAASNITSGTLAIARIPTITVAKGGTGATTAAGALANLGLTATAAELNYCDGVTSNIQTQLNGKAPSSHNHSGDSLNPASIELKGSSSHGGYIDFHYGQSTADYTSRIMESASGKLSITASSGVYINGSKAVTAANFSLSGTTLTITI